MHQMLPNCKYFLVLRLLVFCFSFFPHLFSFPAFLISSCILFVLVFHFYLLFCLYLIPVICIFLPFYVPRSLSIVFRSIGNLINCIDLEMYRACVLGKRKEKNPSDICFLLFFKKMFICLCVMKLQSISSVFLVS